MLKSFLVVLVSLFLFPGPAWSQEFYAGVEPVADRATLRGDGTPALSVVLGYRHGETGFLYGKTDWEFSATVMEGSSGPDQGTRFARHAFRQGLNWNGRGGMRYRLGYAIVAQRYESAGRSSTFMEAAAFAGFGIEDDDGRRVEFLADTSQAFSLLFTVEL